MKNPARLRVPARLLIVASLTGAAACDGGGYPSCNMDSGPQPVCVQPNGCTLSSFYLDDGGMTAAMTCEAGANCTNTTDPNGVLLYMDCHDPSQGCGGYMRTFPDGSIQGYSQC